MLFLSFSVCRLQYKYSKLMMNSGGKECELPTADSCAIMEGEDAEDDVMYLGKKSFFTKIKSFSREVSHPSIHTHIELCMIVRGINLKKTSEKGRPKQILNRKSY